MSGVEPIAGPRVIGDVALALIPDPKAVEAVVGDRNPDEEQLQQKNERQAVQKLDLLAIADRAFEGFGVRDEVFEKESSDGYDAAQRNADGAAGTRYPRQRAVERRRA
jgi:2-oxoglutarate dehydrogenase complex dehydrogenase (E1) component-like enzyme